MVLMAICSVSCGGATLLAVAELKVVKTEALQTVPVVQNVSLTNAVLTETVVIPEIEISEIKIPEWNEEEIRQIELMMAYENPIEDDEPKRDLAWVKEHLYLFYTDEEIRQTTLIIQAEDLIAQSQTIWSAHAWVIVGRVGALGFDANSIIEVLSKPGQFATYTAECLSAEIVPEVEWVVRDVFARKVLEDMGASPAEVGRTVPATHLFFDNRDGDYYNEFYRYCWGDRYNPFEAPYNPYSN